MVPSLKQNLSSGFGTPYKALRVPYFPWSFTPRVQQVAFLFSLKLVENLILNKALNRASLECCDYIETRIVFFKPYYTQGIIS